MTNLVSIEDRLPDSDPIDRETLASLTVLFRDPKDIQIVNQEVDGAMDLMAAHLGETRDIGHFLCALTDMYRIYGWMPDPLKKMIDFAGSIFEETLYDATYSYEDAMGVETLRETMKKRYKRLKKHEERHNDRQTNYRT